MLQPNAGRSNTQVGGIISQTAPMVLDLYRGLYPVVAASRLAAPKHAMGFSNDCLWLADEVAKLLARGDLQESTRGKLEEAQRRSKMLAECWYDETIVSFLAGFYKNAAEQISC